VTLRGEITDPKCFAGAMKPGDGKTHKACAALCLRGGIPPAFRTTGRDGELVSYVLVGPGVEPLEGESLEPLVERVGEPVALRGRPVTLGRLRLFEVAEGSVRRL